MTVVTETPLAGRVAGKPRVIVTRRLLPETEARMSELFDVALNADDLPMTREALVAAMQGCDVLVPTVTDRIDGAMIAEAGTRMGLIANFGAGVDHIDLAAARARQIVVTNTPSVFTDDTADMAMAMIISVPRRLPEGSRMLLDGKWSGWGPSNFLGSSLGGKRLAIVGMGRIGQAVAHRARGFGLEVVYHNRHRLPPAIENMLGARYEPDLDKLIAEADILTLHCPASAGTHHILDATRIASMKPSACVINTARGDIVDEEALIAALESGRLAGAGLDVYAREPAVDPRLLALPNVVLIPHLGSATSEGRGAAGLRLIANVRFWIDGHRPPDQVLEGWA
ncbi:D-glycerate dehydrogenase [Novosphingobium sp. G106]|uniref:2-hydroxyacid dehydrogenase n=1 Tax=Novosphingobium sp. G106 TaxID=2849500 RepID=UPI001C2D815C|nr:D-glycerate dehydrogenase [Novosphingobium sp. G106]MBV1687074.1 D-glycerate dehydrogenase [Novosphingobium sp. G106]